MRFRTGRRCTSAGIMEHVEEAGVHSGDSSCVVPPITIHRALVERIEEYTRRLALAVGVVGLMNVQFIVRGEDVLIIECNPRASRTVPFVSKATGVPLAKVATRVLLGEKLREMGIDGRHGANGHFSVKAPVFPVRPVRGRGSPARPGDALDGGGDGDRPAPSAALSLRRSRRRAEAADVGSGLHLGGEPGQAGGRADRAGLRGPRVRVAGSEGRRRSSRTTGSRPRWCRR
jgi:hypothetical protein